MIKTEITKWKDTGRLRQILIKDDDRITTRISFYQDENVKELELFDINGLTIFLIGYEHGKVFGLLCPQEYVNRILKNAKINKEENL